MDESADKQHNLEDGENKDKMEGDRLKAEEIRRTATGRQWGKDRQETTRSGRAKQRMQKKWE